MDNYVARANIDHFLELLRKDDLPAPNRSVVTSLLIEEENKLGRDLELQGLMDGFCSHMREKVNTRAL